MVICNNCTGGFLYRDYLKKEYDNPFMWTFLDGENFYRLIKNFDKINFLNFRLEFDGKFYNIIIDELIKVILFHHHKSNTEFEIRGIDCYSNDIENYIKEKYVIRVKRMLDSKDKPIFIIGTPYEKTEYGNKWDWKEYYKKIDELKTEYRCIMFSNLFIPVNKEHYNIYERFTDNKELAKEIFDLGII